jgi:hypothetical protein
MMRAMQRACLLLVALAAVGCADRTALLVEVSSPDLAIPGDVDSLTIRAHTPNGAMFDQTFDVASGWPHSITIRPESPEDQGQVLVEVTGNRAGAFVVRRVALTGFQPGVTRRVDISLQRSCVDVRCADDVDCVAGSCVGASVDGGVDAGSDAGGVDGGFEGDGGLDADGVDGGTEDSGGVDAGSDTGMMDAGMRDAGRDAGTDAGLRDGGTDTGPRDTGTDAASPVDAGSDCTGIACLGTVVISEIATGGTGGGTDEFIELYNRGTGTASIGGCVMAYHSASGATRTVRATLPAGTTIAPRRYLLLASGTYSSSPAADFVWPGTTGSADAGGTLSLECSGTVLDRLGYGTGTLAEGTSITPAMTPSGSYERKANAASTVTSMSAGGADVAAGNARDTDQNSLDFVVRTARDPQSSLSPAEP